MSEPQTESFQQAFKDTEVLLFQMVCVCKQYLSTAKVDLKPAFQKQTKSPTHTICKAESTIKAEHLCLCWSPSWLYGRLLIGGQPAGHPDTSLSSPAPKQLSQTQCSVWIASTLSPVNFQELEEKEVVRVMMGS